MFQSFIVASGERALLYRDGVFACLLHPGRHCYFDPLRRLRLERVAVAQGPFEHPLVEQLRRSEPVLVGTEFHDVRVGEREVGLRYLRGALVEVLPPGARRLYWRDAGEPRIVRIALPADLRLPYSLTQRLATPQARTAVAGADAVCAVHVPEGSVARLRIDGEERGLLLPGRHAYWRFGREVAAELHAVTAGPAAAFAAAGGALAG